MHLDFRFRLSLYLTLAVAAVCLGLAEEPLLPGFRVVLGPVLALLLAAFLLEGRWTLPVWAANIVGVAIAAGWGLWLDLRFFDDMESWQRSVPLAAALLPAIGPLLMVLLLVRLFRPKDRGDFWVLHGLGLVQVALGCVLGFTPVFGGLLFAYLACALWSLSLFSLRGGTAGVGLGTPRPSGCPARRPPVQVLPAVRRAVGVAAAGVVLCLLLPRAGSEPWNPLRLVGGGQEAARMQTGAASEIDLNRTGWVELDDEVALVVRAADAAGVPKLDLAPGQRWRGPVLDHYAGGRWESSYARPQGFALEGGAMLGLAEMGADEIGELVAGASARRELMNLGPDQYFLTFEVEPRRAGGLFLAEPVVLPAPMASPREASVVTLRGGPAALFDPFEGTLKPTLLPVRGTVIYRQVTAPPRDPREPELGPAVGVHRNYTNGLTQQPVPELTAWTRELARRLASRPDAGFAPADLALEPALAPGVARDHPDGILKQEHWEKVARGLSAYLAHSADYTYSLELRRQDWNLDPTLDFLRNVRAGHCSRYAGGLALMLRALGVPSRIVTGFRGADGRGDGSYEVRHSMAHAWVEVVVPRQGPDGKEHWYWLALDPTPAGEAQAPPLLSVSLWWDRAHGAWEWFWKDLIVDYGADQQEELWSGVGGSLQRPGAWRLLTVAAGALLAGGVVYVGLRFVRRRRRRRPGAPRGAVPVAFYRRLLAILARRRLRPRPSQTPREFGVEVRQALAGATVPPLASLPAEVAELLYRVRYGGVALTGAEGRDLDRRLTELDAALAGR